MKLKVSYCVILGFLFFSVQQLFGQGIEIGLNFCPSYANRTIDVAESYSSFYKNEKAIFSYNAGVYLIKSLSSNISIRTGLEYSRLGYNYGEVTEISEKDLSTATGTPKIFYEYLTIPMLVQYHLPSDSKISTFGELGFSNNLFLSERFKSIGGDVYKNDQSQARKYQLGLLAGIGAKMKITDHLVITAISNLHYMPFTVENSNNPVQKKLYAIGINCMVGYRLNGSK